MALEKFHFTLNNGHVIVLPKMENVKLGVIRKTRKLAQMDQVFTMLEELLPEEDLPILDDMDREEFEALMGAWRETSETELGKSSAS